MGSGYGYGKTILFGEHFVVYGIPAIASALGSKTIATVQVVDGQGWSIDDQWPATPGYREKKFDEAPFCCVLPICITSFLTISAFFASGFFNRLADLMTKG